MNPIGNHTESKILSKNEMDFMDMTLSVVLKLYFNDVMLRQKVEQLIDGFMWLNRNSPLVSFDDKRYLHTVCNGDNNPSNLIDQNGFMFDIYFNNPFCRVRVKYIKAYNGDWMWDYTDQYEWDEEEDNV